MSLPPLGPHSLELHVNAQQARTGPLDGGRRADRLDALQGAFVSGYISNMRETILYTACRKWLVALIVFAVVDCSVGAAALGFSGKSTISSADGQVQVETDNATGRVTLLRPTPIEMNAIQKRADAGDDGAQMIISDVQYQLKNPAEGERWLRRAVQKGNIYAEFLLGCELTLRVHGGVARPEEGVAWLKLAAYEGYPGAQFELGHCYSHGVGVEESDLEAYSWGLISLRSDFEPGDMMKNSVMRLGSSLSDAQKENARSRASGFVPVVADRNPFVDAGWLKLKTISESNGRPVVVINDQAFSAGEEKKLTVLARSIRVRCLEVRTDSVIVSTEPYWQRGELKRSG